MIRVLAEPKTSPYGQPTAVLSAAHSVEATYSIQLSYGCVRGVHIEDFPYGHLFLRSMVKLKKGLIEVRWEMNANLKRGS